MNEYKDNWKSLLMYLKDYNNDNIKDKIAEKI